MSDQAYRLISTPRDVVRFGRIPGHLPIDDLPMCYSELEDYYKLVVVPNRDRLDYILIEEYSLAPLVRDDNEALAIYLSPLVDGHIAPGTLGYVVAIAGWLVVSFEYIDEHNEEFTVLYLTPTPPGTVMCSDGRSFERLSYTAVH